MSMTKGEAKDASGYCILTAESPEEFLRVLQVGESMWAGARVGDLAFRGQMESAWRLVPGAFRKDQWLGYEGGGVEPQLNRVAKQARAEFNTIREFVKAVDGAGLEVGQAAAMFLRSKDLRYLFQDPDWEYQWPQEEVLEVVALAQHHGVPTRLVDFTDNPLVACYFAAESAWKAAEGNEEAVAPGEPFLAVWVIDLRFIRGISAVRHRFPERMAEVRLPRGNNPYLRAQSGFFLMDRGANDVMHQSNDLSIEQAIGERALYWNSGNRLAGYKVRKNWFADIPIVQVRLRKDFAGDLLTRLDEKGINKGTVMPSMDRVVEGLEMMRCISRRSR